VINYFIPQNTGTAFINIADMNGRLIKNISVTAKGKNHLVLQAGQLASGTYHYSLVVNGNTGRSDKKMMLVEINNSIGLIKILK
jgi:hypothetical protein